MDGERRLFVEHRLFSATRCRCGWEGDSAITHVLDALKWSPDLLLALAVEAGAIKPMDRTHCVYHRGFCHNPLDCDRYPTFYAPQPLAAPAPENESNL